MKISRDEYPGVEKSMVKISCNLFDAPITSEIVGSKSTNSMAPAIIMWNCKKKLIFWSLYLDSREKGCSVVLERIASCRIIKGNLFSH